MRERRGPQYRTGREVPADHSEALREFRTSTAGLSNRLPLASLEGMRAGTVANPHTLARRYLLAARAIGLPKAWALRLVVWLERQVDVIWPDDDRTPSDVLAIRAMETEHRDNLAEKRLDLTRNRANLEARIDALTAELAADRIVLARLTRELEALR